MPSQVEVDAALLRLEERWAAQICGFPKIRGTLSVVPIIRIIIYWGLYWGPPYLGKGPYAPGSSKAF